MDLITKVLNILPAAEVLLSNLSSTISSDEILRQIHQEILQIKETPAPEQCLDFLDIILDFLHDSLHVGEWHAVDVKLRKSYSVASYFKVLILLNQNQNTLETLNDCVYILDMAIMLGDSLGNEDTLQKAATLVTKSISELNPKTSDIICESPLKRFKVDKEVRCDIPSMDKPSIEHFIENYYNPKQPLLLKNTINHWPALSKWKDMNYLVELAGPRTVPIELGSQYTNENWSQSLLRFEDFLKEFVLSPTDQLAYLAQHDLFDQIPEFKEDIKQPEYITTEPRIKAWLGPKGTISPLHTDPTHNLLCQVFGSKKIILAAPEQTDKLYPHEHFILNNTSQIDAETLDLNAFPRVKDVEFKHVVLQSGDVLYIPPKWWHHVRSLSPSFSVSYWFE